MQLRNRRLDLIRLLCASWVAIYHWLGGFGLFNRLSFSIPNWIDLNPPSAFKDLVSIGFVGVPIFFVISGFVLTPKLYSDSSKIFATKRISKIFPTYLIFLTITLIFSNLIQSYGSNPFWIYIKSFFFISYLSHERMLLSSAWSLWPEICFYANIWALIKLRRKFKINFLVLLSSTYVFYLSLSCIFPLRHFLSIDYFPYFILGSIIYEINHQIASTNLVRRFNLILLSIFYVLSFKHLGNWILQWSTSPNSREIYIEGEVIFSITLFLIYRSIKSPRSNRVTFLLGSSSYSFYLLQEILGFNVFRISNYFISVPYSLFLTLLIVWAVSILYFNRVETKLNKYAIKLLS